MQPKSAIAAILMLILLCGSSLASGCELLCCFSPSHPAHKSLPAVSCDLGTSPAEPTAKAAASEMTMSHSHCGHARVTHRGVAITRHFQDATRCATAPCLQAEILSASLSAKNSVQIESRHFVLVALVPAIHSSSNTSARVKRKGARSQVFPVGSLSVALRI